VVGRVQASLTKAAFIAVSLISKALTVHLEALAFGTLAYQSFHCGGLFLCNTQCMVFLDDSLPRQSLFAEAPRLPARCSRYKTDLTVISVHALAMAHCHRPSPRHGGTHTWKVGLVSNAKAPIEGILLPCALSFCLFFPLFDSLRCIRHFEEFLVDASLLDILRNESMNVIDVVVIVLLAIIAYTLVRSY